MLEHALNCNIIDRKEKGRMSRANRCPFRSQEIAWKNPINFDGKNNQSNDLKLRIYIERSPVIS